ncbi:Uncharacterised protein [Klebsiella quasipneumoniae]|nr:Uncharacterised protein [Klebsiella quasipneumoniae]
MRQAIKSPQDAGLNQKRLTGGRYSHSIIKIYKNYLYINSLITRRFHNTMNNAMPRI